MPVIATIDGFDLFSTAGEATSAASEFGLSGYHTHVYNGVIGYMPGPSHDILVGKWVNPNIGSGPTNTGSTPTSGGY